MMATTARKAFEEFRPDVVDLEEEEVKAARASRDFLTDQLSALPGKVTGFPAITERYRYFGSFERKTKIQPLDDIDLMMILNGRDTQVVGGGIFASTYTRRLQCKTRDAPLRPFADEYGYVNSTKILNKIRDSLGEVHQYKKADINKRMQAVTLNLASYAWVFDIVPALKVVDAEDSTLDYLIPDGKGAWIRTDPRIDAQNITAINGQHSGRLLPVMRLLKYWNRRGPKSTFTSYYFETLVLKVFNQATAITTYRSAVYYFLQNAGPYVWSACSDPKGLGPNLDAGVDWITKQSYTSAMTAAAKSAKQALICEEDGDHKGAIGHWTTVFGTRFPSYG